MEILEQSLGRVEAPAELWDRVAAGRETKRGGSAKWVLALACAAAALVWAMYTPALRSDDPAVIRQWVKTRTGMEIPLQRTGTVQLTGARVVNPGKIELAYRAGDHPGVVLVSRAAGSRPHFGTLSVECEAPACGLCHS
jgi:hypothetical protein